LGKLTLDVVHDFSRTSIVALDLLDDDELRSSIEALDAEAVAALERERVPAERRMLRRFLDVRYESQEHVLTLPVPGGDAAVITVDELRRMFDDAHQASYGYRLSDPVEVTAFRVRATGSMEKPSRPLAPIGRGAEKAHTGTREAVHRESGGRLSFALYARERLGTGDRLEGPAIIEELAATTLVAPGQSLTVDTLGNLIIASS
jgi:N-methylhydantoinase A